MVGGADREGVALTAGTREEAGVGGADMATGLMDGGKKLLASLLGLIW